MKKEKPKFQMVIKAVDGLSLGISIVVAILIGVGLGIVMKNLFGHSWLLWLGIFWGMGAAILNVYKVYKQQKASLDELANDPRYRYKGKGYDSSDEKDY